MRQANLNGQSVQRKPLTEREIMTINNSSEKLINHSNGKLSNHSKEKESSLPKLDYQSIKKQLGISNNFEKIKAKERSWFSNAPEMYESLRDIGIELFKAVSYYENENSRFDGINIELKNHLLTNK